MTLIAVPSAAEGVSVHLSINSSGHLSAELQVTVTNGSALREAMDGNFVPLVDLITSNATQQSNWLGQISTAESAPFLSAYFGNRDGTVSANEVSLFETLLQQESQFLPSTTLTSSPALALTLDGAAPTSVTVSSVTFEDASGPASSTSSLGVAPTLSFAFPFAGASHVLALSANVTSVGFTLAPIVGSVNLTLTVPAGQAITQSDGFASAQVSNDPLGWGPSTFSGSYSPSTHSELSVSFANAFPTGDVVLGAVGVGAVTLALVLLLRRRRRRRAAMAPAEPAT